MFDERVIGQLDTVRDFLRWGTSAMAEAGLFFGHGTDSAVDEMDWLLAYCLSLPPGLASEFFDARLLVTEKERVYRLVEERIRTRKPLAYLLGECWFAGLKFRIDERALIPRSPIGELIEQRFTPWVRADAVSSILDVGTGSGCLAIACALAFPAARVDAVDNSSEALQLARINRANYGLESRLELIESDLFDSLRGRAYDVIVANPPYVPDDEVRELPEEYSHEPWAALASGEDGLAAMGRILTEAGAFLNPGGGLIGEVGLQWPELQEKFSDIPFTWLDLERGGEGVFLLRREQFPR